MPAEKAGTIAAPKARSCLSSSSSSSSSSCSSVLAAVGVAAADATADGCGVDAAAEGVGVALLQRDAARRLREEPLGAVGSTVFDLSKQIRASFSRDADVIDSIPIASDGAPLLSAVSPAFLALADGVPPDSAMVGAAATDADSIAGAGQTSTDYNDVERHIAGNTPPLKSHGAGGEAVGATAKAKGEPVVVPSKAALLSRLYGRTLPSKPSTGVGHATWKLLPLLMVAGVASTMLVFILLIMHQRYHQKVGGGSASQKLSHEAACPAPAVFVVPKAAPAPPPPPGQQDIAESSEQVPAASASTLVGAAAEVSAVSGKASVLVSALVVPRDKRISCLLQRRLCNERQEVEFDITSGHNLGRKRLLVGRASETRDGAPCKVQLEQLPGPDGEPGKPLAWLRTEELWDGQIAGRVARGDALAVPLCRDTGELFGRIVKVGDDHRGVIYQVFAESSGISEPIVTFVGDFEQHSVKVFKAGISGKQIATCEPSQHQDDHDVSQVKIEPFADAGVVLLGLMAVDKLQRHP